MGKLTITPKQQADLQTQARILVTVAVAANLLFALILSCLMLFGDQKPQSETEESHTEFPYQQPSLTSSSYTIRTMPSPDKW